METSEHRGRIARRPERPRPPGGEAPDTAGAAPAVGFDHRTRWGVNA